ncbi:MAG: mechanosensitive ion channel family protein [Polyangiaceae bacterium]|nr:mechanosensitive ion channel family protein [Polyangiaceae bacterium]
MTVDADTVVELFGQPVFAFRVSRAGRGPAERAGEARQALDRASSGARAGDVDVERRGDVAIVMVRGAPTIHLGVEDAHAAGASSVDALAADVATRLRSAFAAERRRAVIVRTILSVSLVVILALVAIYLIRLVRDYTGRGRRWLDTNAERVPALSLRSIEVVNARVVRAVLELGLMATSWVVLLGIAYTWLVFALSRFESTRGYTARLAGFVLSPLSSLVDRLVTTVPPTIVGLVAAAALVVLLRFLSLFFAAVGRGETQLAWLSPDLAAPTSVIARIGVVVVALVFLGPVVTGDPESPLSLLGGVAVAAVGLASTPLIAGALVGTVQIYTGRLRTGQIVAAAGRVGRVAAVNLLEIRLVDGFGNVTRVPHLAALLRPVRVLGEPRRVAVRLSFPAGALSTAAAVNDLLMQLRAAAGTAGEDPRAEIIGIGASVVRFRVSAASDQSDARSVLFAALVPIHDRAARPPAARPSPLGSPR